MTINDTVMDKTRCKLITIQLEKERERDGEKDV